MTDCNAIMLVGLLVFAGAIGVLIWGAVVDHRYLARLSPERRQREQEQREQRAREER